MKYPIILVHGVMIKDFKFFKAFGRIEGILNKNGYKCYTADIDGMGSTITNAEQLKTFILEVLRKDNVDKVNLIAHSKGGLDSKYMIENLGMDDKVSSLITLCTPYKGSPIATTILRMPGWIIWCAKTWFNVIYKIFKDKKPDALKVCKELALVDSIEDKCMSLKEVYVESYSTKLNRSRDNFLMGIPHAFCRYFYKEEENDGLVSSDSAKFINYQGDCLNESISHTDIVDFMIGKKKREKIHMFYLKLASRLQDKGF